MSNKKPKSELKLPTGTLKEQLKTRIPRSEKVVLAHNPADADKLRLARNDAEQLRLLATNLADGLMNPERAAMAADAKQKADEAQASANSLIDSIDVWEFEFHSIGHARRVEMEEAHPPTDTQIAEAKRAQRAMVEANANIPKHQQQPIPGLPDMDSEGLTAALIEATMHSVTRWPHGKAKDPVKFSETLTAEDVAELAETAGWAAMDRGALSAAALTVDLQESTVTWESVGKG